MGKRFVWFVTLLVTNVWLVTAQISNVSGVVVSREDGEPVIGASVLVKGTTTGTITDIDGKFNFQNLSPSARTLVVSYVGMQTREVDITSENLSIELETDTEVLEEVVVTAMGLTRKEKSIGYSTQKVNSEQLTVARQTDLGNAMAGKISGARFFGASGATFDAGSIVLRGTTDFTSPEGNEPIYVVDGTITNKNSINMDDVESINVLKGAAATALYGSEGGNGAIIITSKRANEGKGRIEVSHTTQWEKYYNHFDMQKLYGGGSYGELGDRLAAQYGNQYDTMSPQFLYGIYGGMQNPDGSYYYDYNSDESWGARYDPNVNMASALYWDSTSRKYGIADPYVHRLNVADLFRTGVMNTTNVAFSKAGKDYSTRISFTNSQREGIQQNSDAIRRFFSVNSNFKPTDWLNVSLDYKYTYRRNHNGAQEGYGGTRNIMHEYLQWSQGNIDLNDYRDYMRPDGSWRTWNITGTDNMTAQFHDNPYAIFDHANIYDTYQWNVFTGDAEASLPFNLKVGVRVMGSLRNYHYEEEIGMGSINLQSGYTEHQSHISDLTVQGRLTWSNRFIDDRLTMDAAAFIEERNYNYGILRGNTTNGLIINDYFNLAASSGYVGATNEEQHYKTRSVYATATLGWDNTYFLDGSLRNDWDSRLPIANNSYLYGGLSGSIMLNNFLKGASWLNYWKLRASLAQVGSTLNVYRTIPTYNVTNSDNDNFRYNALTSLYPSATQLNPNIQPTISTAYEVGTEFRMFNNRLWGDINYYRRDTKNQILNVTVAPQSGYSSRQLNAGMVRNRGIEISLGGTLLRTKSFQWDVDANIARNVNRLVRLNDEINEYTLEGNRFYYNWYLKAEVGKPIGVITTMSRWQRNENGELLLQRTDATSWGGGYAPVMEADVEREVGNFQPDWTGGFSTSLHYKNFRLSASFDYMIGGQIVSWTNLWSTGSGTNISTAGLNNNGVNVREPMSNGGGVFVNGVDAETGERVSAYMNAYTYYHNQAHYDNDNWVYDRTYLKMRELSLSYTFPSSLLAKAKIGLSDASISFVANNPWLIYSAVPNIDPSEAGSNWIEGGQAASTRSFGLTVKLGF